MSSICIEPTKEEIFNWITSKLKTLPQYENFTIKMYEPPLFPNGALQEYSLILEGPPDNLVIYRQDFYRNVGSGNIPEEILKTPDDIYQKISTLADSENDYEIMLEILRRRGVKDPLECFISIMSARLNNVKNNQNNLILLYLGLSRFTGFQKKFDIGWPYPPNVEEKRSEMIEAMLSWIRDNIKEEPTKKTTSKPVGSFELFPQLPRDMQKVIANEFLNDPENYKNLITTNKTLSQIDHDYNFICSEPTKKEMLAWILNKVSTLADDEIIMIQFRYGEYQSDPPYSNESWLKLSKGTIENIFESHGGHSSETKLDTINALWRKLDILTNGPTEYQIILEILSKREQLKRSGQVIKCFCDLIKNRMKDPKVWSEDILNGLIGLLNEEDGQYYSDKWDAGAPVLDMISEVMDFIENNF